jgi:hypothetical protein
MHLTPYERSRSTRNLPVENPSTTTYDMVTFKSSVR